MTRSMPDFGLFLGARQPRKELSEICQIAATGWAMNLLHLALTRQAHCRCCDQADLVPLP